MRARKRDAWPVTVPETTQQRVTARKGVHDACLLVGLVALMSSVMLFLLVEYQGYSIALLLLPASAKRADLSEAELPSFLSAHTFLFIGGPHRGGTTLLWRLLASHADVSAFPETTGDSDFSEGAFLQSVLPTFGVGQESRRPRHQLDGLGRFAFSASAHLTESSPLNSAASSLVLSREWAFYWNLSRRVLLEKTPSNMLTSRLLQALLAPSAKFIFISRHPVAVALAHQRWRECARDPLSQLTLHWVVSHLILAHDRPRLAAARIVRYEG